MKNKLKIFVYAICKNEEKFVDRFYDSVKDADGIYVLDTGSTDNTVLKLKEKNIHVFKYKINPWRFDNARNLALDLVPSDADICISLDLDEALMPNWRKCLEENWKDGTNRVRYTYHWYIDQNDNPKISFYSDKIHSRNNYRWVNPVHEVLKFEGEEKTITIDDLVIRHYPDRTKSRSSYLPLLELAVKENPENDRNTHYLGREYMYYEKYNEAIDMLIKHLSLKSATWKDERCASMRFISRCYKNINRFEEAKMWALKAIEEAPYLRDGYMEAAMLYYELEDYNKVIELCNEALKIPKNNKSYINELYTFDETVFDLLSISYYKINNLKEAIDNARKALEINPSNERIQNNLNYYLNVEE